MNKKGLKIVIPVVISILLIPFIAMQFTDEVNWEAGDFLLAFILLSTMGFSVYFALNLMNIKLKWLTITLIVFLFILVWIELAVGIFGTPFAGD